MATAKITKQEIDKFSANGRDQLFWDDKLIGFGMKVTAKGVKSYIVQYRTAGGRRGLTRRVTIGRHGSPWTAESARTEAKRILASVVGGDDPAQRKRDHNSMPSVAQLCDLYLRDGVGMKKQSTLSTDRGRIERHIKPLLGRRKIDEVSQADVRRVLVLIAEGKTATDVKTGVRGRAIVRGGKGTASRTLGLLGGIFTYAVELGLIQNNPVHGVKRFPDKKNERFLSASELARVGAALRDAELKGRNINAIDILRLLVFTGARRGEIETLRWSEVDLPRKRIRLSDSKTGQKTIPLNDYAYAILARRIESPQKSDHVFPAASGEGHYVGTPRFWSKLREQAELMDVRIHDLRHSFASVGASSGVPLMIVGALLGHRNHSTTQRYAHLADDPVATASDVIGRQLADMFEPNTPPVDIGNNS